MVTLPRSNRLLLQMGFTKVNIESHQSAESDALESVYDYFINTVNFCAMEEEMASFLLSVKNGVAGIYWLSKQLYNMTGRDDFKRFCCCIGFDNQESKLDGLVSQYQLPVSCCERCSLGLFEGGLGFILLN